MSQRNNVFERRSYEGEPDGSGVTHAVTLEHSDYHYYDVTACKRYADDIDLYPAPPTQAVTCLRCVVQVLGR